MRIFHLILLMYFLGTSNINAKSKNSLPNFIVIFTDDQGYEDLGCFGSTRIKTPNLDRMADEGAKLTSFYVAAPVCTPSRAALMTGSYPARNGMERGSRHGVLLSADTKGLNPEEITIAEILKTAGYKSGIFGKWHLGDQPEFLPTRQGFDEFFGLPYSHDLHPYHPNNKKHNFPALPLLSGEDVVELDPDLDFLTRRFTEGAVSFIKENKNDPFFLYVPHPIPHRPIHMSPSFMENIPEDIKAELEKEDGTINYNLRDKIYAYSISEIDWSVGEILKTLKEEGIDENTIVLFTSDNGPSKGGSAYPLKGKKGSVYEGGMRMPAIIRWPSGINARQVNNELLTAMDLLPTFAKIAGADIPSDRVIDGKDVLAVLQGKAETPHKAFFYQSGEVLKAVRSGKWKLHFNKDKPVELYNLDTDISESNNVLESNTAVAEMLMDYVRDFREDIKNNSRPAAFIENPKALTIQ